VGELKRVTASVWCILLLVIAPFLNASERSPQRIIALSPHSVELLFLLGVGDRIVGTTEYADFPEQAKSIPRIGGYTGIQIDRLLELEPDLVVAWESGNPADDLKRIKQLGLPLHLSQTEQFEDIPVEIERLGKLVGKPEEAAKQADLFRSRYQALQAQYASRTPVRFFYQLWSDPLRTMAAGSWINTIMRGCGGQNVADDASLDYPQVSLEWVVDVAPEVIVVPTHHGGKMDVSMWKNWPEIPAVKNEHYLYVNGDLLHRFSYRVLDGMQAVCESFDQIRSNR